MVYSRRAELVMLLATLWLVVVVEGQKDAPSCSREGDVQATVDSERINGTCFVVNLTNIEVCENSGWREICDADFTDSDAEVICRQLNYSDIGAVAGRFSQLFGGFPTTMSPVCSGTESMLSECSIVASGVTSSEPDCSHNKVSVICFPKGSDGSVCGTITDTTTAADSNSTAAPATTPSDSTNSATSSPGSTTAGSPGDINTSTDEERGTIQSTNKPDTTLIVVIVLGIVVLISLLSLLMLIIVACSCYKCKNRHSPLQGVGKEIMGKESSLNSDLVEKTQKQHASVLDPMYDTIKDKSVTPGAYGRATGVNTDSTKQHREDIKVDLKENIAYATRTRCMDTENEFDNLSHHYDEVVDLQVGHQGIEF